MKWKSYKDTFGKIILSGGADEKEYRQIEKEVLGSNRNVILIFSNVVVLILFCLFLVSFLVENLAGNRSIYGGFLLPCIALSVAAWKAKDKKIPIYLVTYLFMGTLMTIGILMGTVWGPREVTAVFIAILLIVPQLFIDRPWRLYLLISVTVTVFILMVILYKDPVTWTSDITNTAVFGVLSALLCTYTAFIRVARFILEERNLVLARYDQLTGLKNRNSYEMRLQELASGRANGFFCVYIDVNGLHEINNTKGHEAGDRMLQCVARAVEKAFSKEGSYRVGGDEFVVLGENKDPAEIQCGIEQVREEVQEAGYHAAFGMAHCADHAESVPAIVKAAEREMYRDKAKYYEQSGIDRRNNYSLQTGRNDV